MKTRDDASPSKDGMGAKRQINARLPDKLHKLISDRARDVDETEGGYLATIVQWWQAKGAPPVNDYEARLLAGKPSASAKAAPRSSGRDAEKG
jgi:hypothetical protein